MPNKPRRSNNPKRKLVVPKPDQAELAALAQRVHYGGNPEHKRHSGDFELTPPSAPRSDKTLCDGAGIRSKSDALSALRRGVKKGLVSRQMRGAFPQNVWSVADGVSFEAQLENQEAGTYHGYPLPEADPFSEAVKEAWNIDE
jgi:hypothetical protein